MEFVQANGTRLAVRPLGEGGTALVLLHGLGLGSAATWYFPIALPLAEDRQVIVYDLRGHGDSDTPPAGYSLANQADDLNALLTALTDAREQIDLAGHSLGAAIALHFALSRPERVRRLALIDLPYPFEEHAFAGLHEGSAPAARLEELLASGGRPGEGERRRTRREQRLTRLFLETSLVGDLGSERSPPPEALATLNLPVLLVSGRHSNCLAGNQALQRRLPDARLIELDCGHEVPEEAPGELRTALQGFFSR